MNLFKVDSKIIMLAIVLIVVGVAIALAMLVNLHFNVSELLNHGGTWYAPLNWQLGY